MKLFRRHAQLNGDRVYEGDILEWTDSDNVLRRYPLEYSKHTKRLFFCNHNFPLSAYHELRKGKEEGR
jgi:intergrase/recombinase